MEDTSYLDLKSSIESVPVKALNYSSRIILSNNLDVKLVLPSKNGQARDYRGLAELIGFQYSEIKKFERFEDPTMKIIEAWETHNDSTLGKLIGYLEEMERHDVIKELLPLLERNAETYTKSEKLQENPIQVPEVTSCPENMHTNKDMQVLTCGGITYYDAYVSYADEDCEFVRELAKYLESPEIGFKLFIRGRDMLAGCAELDTNIELIKNRCRQMLIILSPNFLKSPACEFQASFATSLAIDQRQRMLIPIVLAPCEIPSILKYVSKIDFTKPDIHDWIWEKLIKSLLPNNVPFTYSSQSSSQRNATTFRSITTPSSNNVPVVTFPQSTKLQTCPENNSVACNTSVVPVENAVKESAPAISKVSSPKKWRFQLSSHLRKGRTSSSTFTNSVSNSSLSGATSGFHSQSRNTFESSVEGISDDTSV